MYDLQTQYALVSSSLRNDSEVLAGTKISENYQTKPRWERNLPWHIEGRLLVLYTSIFIIMHASNNVSNAYFIFCTSNPWLD